MTAKLQLGDRIIVSANYHWAKSATGKIGSPPPEAVALSGPWESNLTRAVTTRRGKSIFYWVWFDDPQHDADGDGPYTGGEIPETELIIP